MIYFFNIHFSSFFKCIGKTINRYDETESHEVRHRKGRPRVTWSMTFDGLDIRLVEICPLV